MTDGLDKMLGAAREREAEIDAQLAAKRGRVNDLAAEAGKLETKAAEWESAAVAAVVAGDGDARRKALGAAEGRSRELAAVRAAIGQLEGEISALLAKLAAAKSDTTRLDNAAAAAAAADLIAAKVPVVADLIAAAADVDRRLAERGRGPCLLQALGEVIRRTQAGSSDPLVPLSDAIADLRRQANVTPAPARAEIPDRPEVADTVVVVRRAFSYVESRAAERHLASGSFALVPSHVARRAIAAELAENFAAPELLAVAMLSDAQLREGEGVVYLDRGREYELPFDVAVALARERKASIRGLTATDRVANAALLSSRTSKAPPTALGWVRPDVEERATDTAAPVQAPLASPPARGARGRRAIVTETYTAA